MDNTNPSSEDKYKDLNEFITPEKAEQQPEDVPAGTDASPQRPEPAKPKGSKRKKLLISLAVVLLLAGAAAAWFLIIGKEKAQAPAANDRSAAAGDDTKTELKPARVAYAFGDAAERDVNIFSKPLTGGDRSGNTTFLKNNYLTQYGVHKNKVFYITEPGFGARTDAAPTIRYSEDGGKSYTTVYEGNVIGTSNLGDQITSARFSSDGSRIVFGLLPKDGSNNQVKELDPSTKAVKDLFTVEQRGVFIHAYDVSRQLLFYTQGCYNCDGVALHTMLARDLKTNTGSTLYEDSERQIINLAFNQDLSKLLVVSGSGETESGFGAGAPFKLREFDVAAKTFKTLLSDTDSTISAIGYSEEGLVYFASKNKVTQVAANGNQSVLFEAAKPIYQVLFVSQDQVVAGVGDVSDFELANYDVKENKTTSILSGDNVTYLFGVTWE